MRRSAIVTGILAASILSTGTALADGENTSNAAATRAIGPNQHFTGLVNGSPVDGVIRLRCRTAARGGHPVAGQSVSVRRLFPTTPTLTGFTGNASTIAAALHFPVLSSAASPGPAPIPLAVFSAYEQRVAIPTTLTLPCGGSGVIVFDPVQGGNTARAVRQPVKFVPGA